MDGSHGTSKVVMNEQVFSFYLLKQKWPCLTGQPIMVTISGPSGMLCIKSPARFTDFRLRNGPLTRPAMGFSPRAAKLAWLRQ